MTPRPVLDRWEAILSRVAGALLVVLFCGLAAVVALMILTWAGCGAAP
jgi:hypothetical protein